MRGREAISTLKERIKPDYLALAPNPFHSGYPYSIFAREGV